MGKWTLVVMAAAGALAAGVLPLAGAAAEAPPPPGAMTLEQTLSDQAQRTTIAFSGLAFMTGTTGTDSFFPPGKVADWWGFQYLRDNDPSHLGHNTDFLTKASLNMLTVLTSGQRQELVALAKAQVADINDYGMGRFTLMAAFRRRLEGDTPNGRPYLDRDAVRSVSADLYRLDGRISADRARVMGGQLRSLTVDQRSYLDAMVGQGMASWPTATEPPELMPLSHDEKVAVMTYAGDMFSWYAGSVDADVYFCPERHGTYYGGFYLKDAPAVGNPGYTIGDNITAEKGQAFLDALTAQQAATITDLVEEQRSDLAGIVTARTAVATLLRRNLEGATPAIAEVDDLMTRYGELDGDMNYLYAEAFAEVYRTLTDEQKAALEQLRLDTVGDLHPDGAFLYAEPIPMPDLPDTDWMFTAETASPTADPEATASPTPSPSTSPEAAPTTDDAAHPARPHHLRVKATVRRVTAAWHPSVAASGYSVLVRGRNRTHHTVTRSRSSAVTEVAVRVRLFPGSSLRVCVRATNAHAVSPARCSSARVK